MRYLIGFMFILALGVMGCSEAAGTGGSGGSAGSGGSGGEQVGAQCTYPEGEISDDEYFQGVRCEEGLTEIAASRLLYPCSGEDVTCRDGCTVPPPCFCLNCTPCGDGQCQCELGENACNCPVDCD